MTQRCRSCCGPELVNISTEQERPLDADEMALYEVVQDVARDVLESGDATLAVSWRQLAPNAPRWPDFDLQPRNPDSLPITISPGSGDWIDTTLNVDGDELNFELWAKTFEERLAQVRERIQAVIEGRVELKLQRHRWLLFRSWTLVATFEVTGGADETSRGPASPAENRHLFPEQPGAEAAGLLGPRRFAPYAE